MVHVVTVEVLFFNHIDQLIFFPNVAESQSGGIRDQRVWTVKECASVFEESMLKLKEQLEQQSGENAMLVWDKVCTLLNVQISHV